MRIDLCMLFFNPKALANKSHLAYPLFYIFALSLFLSLFLSLSLSLSLSLYIYIYSRFGLEHDDSLIDVYQDILAFENLGKVLIMADFNARVGKYQTMDISKENILDPCLLHDSKDCIVIDHERISNTYA